MVDEVKAKLLARFPFLTEDASFESQLSSIELVEFVTYIEETFHIQIHAIEYSSEMLRDFDSVSRMIEHKQKI